MAAAGRGGGGGGGVVNQRYQLGARVAGGVACAWSEQWVAATTAGDDAGAKEAVDAMATAADWPILVEMDAEGAYGQVLRHYAAGMTEGGPVEPEVVARYYRDGFGCDD